MLAHELAHIRRHDYLVNFLQTLVETLLFYHPAVWWVSHTVRVERELRERLDERHVAAPVLAEGRLVEDEQRGRRGECRCHRQATLLATGKRERIGRRQVRQAQALHQLVGAL